MEFVHVNSSDDIWNWKDGVLHCTGQSFWVQRTASELHNFEIVVEWMHEKARGATVEHSSGAHPSRSKD